MAIETATSSSALSVEAVTDSDTVSRLALPWVKHNSYPRFVLHKLQSCKKKVRLIS